MTEGHRAEKDRAGRQLLDLVRIATRARMFARGVEGGFVVRDRADRDDVEQQAIVQLLEAARRNPGLASCLSSRDALGAYVRVVVRHAAIGAHHARRRETPCRDDVLAHLASIEAPIEPGPEDAQDADLADAVALLEELAQRTASRASGARGLALLGRWRALLALSLRDRAGSARAGASRREQNRVYAASKRVRDAMIRTATTPGAYSARERQRVLTALRLVFRCRFARSMARLEALARDA